MFLSSNTQQGLDGVSILLGISNHCARPVFPDFSHSICHIRYVASQNTRIQSQKHIKFPLGLNKVFTSDLNWVKVNVNNVPKEYWQYIYNVYNYFIDLC